MHCNLLSLLFTIGLLLQLRCINSVEIENLGGECGESESKFADLCKKEHKTPRGDYRQACCNSFAIEKCIIKGVPEECKVLLRDRYANDGLKKGPCKEYVGNCDDLSTTYQSSNSPQFNAKPETLKQSISHIPQTQTTQLENQNLVAQEQKKNGGYSMPVSKGVLFMVTCGSLVMVNLLSRWF